MVLSALWFFFLLIGLSDMDFELLLLTAWGSCGCSVTVLFPDLTYCMLRCHDLTLIVAVSLQIDKVCLFS